MAGVMAEAIRPLVTSLEVDSFYAVPLHRRRKRSRGFDQAELLLKRLDMWGGPGRLQRVRATPSQVGLNVEERRANIKGAFRYRGPKLRGTVAVVDDVVTSGATAGECARILKENGADKVFAVAFARASLGGWDEGEDVTRPPSPPDGILG